MSMLLLSGPICAGKSSIARGLIERYGFTPLRTGPYLASRAANTGRVIYRGVLQEIGDALDLATDYRWVVDEVMAPAIAAHGSANHWLLDAVRKDRQVEHIRQVYSGYLLHIHLNASDGVLEARYKTRRDAGNDYSTDVPYAVAVSHPNEQAARQLIRVADWVVDTEAKTADQIVSEILGDQRGKRLCDASC